MSQSHASLWLRCCHIDLTPHARTTRHPPRDSPALIGCSPLRARHLFVGSVFPKHSMSRITSFTLPRSFSFTRAFALPRSFPSLLPFVQILSLPNIYTPPRLYNPPSIHVCSLVRILLCLTLLFAITRAPKSLQLSPSPPRLRLLPRVYDHSTIVPAPPIFARTLKPLSSRLPRHRETLKYFPASC